MSISEHRSKKGVLTDDMRLRFLLSGFITGVTGYHVKFSEINFYSCHFVL